MNTQLDKKAELILKIAKLSYLDILLVKTFIAGMEAERIAKEEMNENKIEDS